MKYAVLFPGQGSQKAGMGAELFEARPDLLQVDAGQILEWSLRELCLEGAEEELTSTDRAQPAIYALSYALWEEFAKQFSHPPAGGAGHSLGEYSALAAARVFTFKEGLRLVAARGQAMAEAAQREPSAMAALLGVDVETAQAVTSTRRGQGGRLWVANLNAPGQVVVAGGKSDIEWLIEKAKVLGIRRVVKLKVAGAFHTPFMEPALLKVKEALEQVNLQESSFPVWSNVTGQPLTASKMEELLAKQVVSSVQFSQAILSMTQAGIDTFVHVGPGDVTAGFIKRTVPDARVLVVNSLESATQVAQTLRDE